MDFDKMDAIMGVDEQWSATRIRELVLLRDNVRCDIVKHHVQVMIDFISDGKDVPIGQWELANDYLTRKGFRINRTPLRDSAERWEIVVPLTGPYGANTD